MYRVYGSLRVSEAILANDERSQHTLKSAHGGVLEILETSACGELNCRWDFCLASGFLGGSRLQRSAPSSLFTHPRDAAFTSTRPERG
jgi:hypothetical protein